MPELPEVELFRRYFTETSLHKKINAVKIPDTSILGKVSANKLETALIGKEFSDTARRGKYMFAQAGSKWLVLHFGMTGYLKYYRNEDEKPSHIKLLIQFSNNYHLAYVCIRKLGVIDLIDNLEKFIYDNKLGIDPLDNNFTFDDFYETVSNGKGKIEPFFMNQKHIAGLGNMYVDELLFHSRLYPESDISKLDKKTIHTLFKNMNKILRKALDIKTDTKRFPNTYLISHRKKDENCPRCKGNIEMIKLSGRSTYLCNMHQQKL